MATQPVMAIRSYHVWHLQEAEIPAVVELAYAARISQAISHILFRDWPDEKIQRSQCERAVRAAFNDPSSTCTIVKHDRTGEVVAFCIAKRHLPAEDKAKIPDQQSKSRNEKDMLPVLPSVPTTEPENKGKARFDWRGPDFDWDKVRAELRGTKPQFGAMEYEPEPHNIDQSFWATEEGNLKPDSEARVQFDTVSAKEPVPTVKGDSKSSGQDSEPKAGNEPIPKETKSDVPFFRNSAWSEAPGTDPVSRAICDEARCHMNILDKMMQGSRYIEIEYLWVKPGHRTQGLGSRFVGHCIKQTKTHQVPLYVRAEPTAREFFSKLKFTDTMSFTLDLAKHAEPHSGYGVHQSSWMRWCPEDNEQS